MRFFVASAFVPTYVEAMETNMNTGSYIMTKDAHGVWSVTFGPFRDIATAKIAGSRLGKHGLKAKAVGHAEAKEIDPLGVAKLTAKSGGKFIDEA